MQVVEAHGSQARVDYLRLFRNCRLGHSPVPGFTQSFSALVTGRPLYLRNHFKQRLFFLRDGNKHLAAVIAFLPLSTGQRSLGGFLAVEHLELQAIHMLLDHVIGTLGGEFLMPLNGHVNFGVSAVNPSVPAEKVTVLTSGHIRGHEALFEYPGAKIEKTYYALSTSLTADKVATWENEIRNMPRGVSTRPIAMNHFKRDIAIHGNLCNEIMKDLDYFEPMSAKENWDLMGASWPLISPSVFQFLVFEGREVGFCFGMLDFNQVIGRSGDVMATVKALSLRHKIRRGRILSTGVLPEFRGQNLIKYARNKVLLAFAGMAVEEVESSYVDELNANSLGNVRSKGAEISHSFSVFRNSADCG